MDAEKLSMSTIAEEKRQVRAEPKSLRFLRAAQHVFATITVAFVACAIDRNIVMPGVTGEEKALCASVSFERHPIAKLL